MTEVVLPSTFIHRAIRPSVHSVAVLLVILPFTLEAAAIRLFQHPLAMPKTILPRAIEHRLIRPSIHSTTVLLAILPLTLIDASIGSSHRTAAMF
jgi:hypothetical protein